ncbi:response regulator [Methanosarcina sp.]|jgi:two-component system cell cycle response regulator DivK|uniref:response regulator n=1 Tax=Methanosarcina sp. TaxID=2213 RepID=UPI002C397532|nr:response regulator [Methanosarcina sp.]HOW13935.1 response regulator [Methanosarcina sp.]
MKRILVVEDSAVIMELIRFLLTTFGYESKEAKDGFEALKIAKENKFDLILLDIQLPGFDGLEVLKEIKKLPEIRKTPVIALTAHAMQGDEERFLKAGCSGYISKPIDIGRFKSILDSCMGRQQVL